MGAILAIDQGTTSSRALIFNKEGKAYASGQATITQHYPASGWVEHDAQEIWQSVRLSIDTALRSAEIKASALDAIGITNQRETVVLWDKITGEPVARAIVWQDRRTASHITTLVQEGLGEEITSRTGLIPDAYFSASKIAWLLEHVEGLRARAEAGDIAFGTVDSWLVYKLTDGACHVTDVTNASRTMLCNIHSCTWDDRLLEIFAIPRQLLPDIVDSCGIISHTSHKVLGAEIPIAAIAGDQQAATFGHLCLEAGKAKNTYGTGCFMVSPTGTDPAVSQHKLLTTVARRHAGEQLQYALEGSLFSAGAAIDWAARMLGLENGGAGLSSLAADTQNSNGVYFVPALAGLGAPHWNPYAQGIWLGITAATTRAEMARAVLEGVAFGVNDLLSAMQQDLDQDIRELMVDGGVTHSDLLMQFQADISNVTVIRPDEVEATAQGVAYMAGLATGIWQDISALQALPCESVKFTPAMDTPTRDMLLSGWQCAVNTALYWADARKDTTV